MYYRQTNLPDVLKRISLLASRASGFKFQPTLVFIATWDEVPAFDGKLKGFINTFQVILATDGTYSFAGFIYKDIQWAENVQIGFNAGDGHGYSTPLTTADIQDNEQGSNTMLPGVYMYRTDSELS